MLAINDLLTDYAKVIEESSSLRISFIGVRRHQSRRPRHRRVKNGGYEVQTLQEYH
jgi:hypothetical protein